MQDNDYNGGKLLKQTGQGQPVKQVVFPDENGKIRKLVKRKNITLTYDPVGTKEFNGMKLKEPIRVSIKSKFPIDLTSVQEVIFDKTFKKAKKLTDMDTYLLREMPNLRHIDVTNVMHISNYDEHFARPGN